MGAAETGPTLQMARDHPQTLVLSVIQKELGDPYGTRPPLRYRLRKVTGHMDTTKEIIETRDGGVACLVATGGRPLATGAWLSERDRLQYLRAHPALQDHRRIREQDDTARVKKVLRALPDAFLYTYAGVVSVSSGPALRLTFVPDPEYRPSDFETRVLRGMRGELWIDLQQQRMVRFEAHLFENVDFAWGILGYVDKGGSVLIEQSDVVPPIWTLTHMHLSLTGRALLVKPLTQEVEETATDHQQVPVDLSYQRAIDLLLQDNCGQGTARSPSASKDQQ
jgi:hypothetical protein